MPFLFLLNMGAGVIEYFDEFRAVKHCVLVALVKGYGTMGTRTGAEHTEHTGAEVIFVFGKTFALFAILGLVHFTCHLDCPVWTCHLTKAASNALMLVLFIMRHRQRAAEAFEHYVRGSVFRVLLCNLGGKKLAHGGLETCAEAFQSTGNTAYITIFFHMK